MADFAAFGMGRTAKLCAPLDITETPLADVTMPFMDKSGQFTSHKP